MLRAPADAHARRALVPYDLRLDAEAGRLDEVEQIYPHTPVGEDVGVEAWDVGECAADQVLVAACAEDVVGDLRGLAVLSLGADAAGRLLRLLAAARAVWRVGQQDLGLVAVEQQGAILRPGAVSAEDAVPAEDPEVAVLCDRRGRGRDLGVGVAARLLGVQRLRERRHDVAVVVLGVAAEHERDLAGVYVGENLGEHLVVSSGELRDAVVCRQIGQLLGLACVVLIVDRGVGQVVELRGHETAVALCDEPAALADGDRGAPARRSDDRGEELDLLRRVLVGVFGIRPQILQRDDGVVRTEHGDAAGVCLRRGRGAVLLDLGAGLRLRFIHGRHLLRRIASRSTCGGWSPASCFGRQDGFSAVPVSPPRPPR